MTLKAIMCLSKGRVLLSSNNNYSACRIIAVTSYHGSHTSFQNNNYCTSAGAAGAGGEQIKPTKSPETVLQRVPSLSEALMTKVYHYMAVYEEFIGIKQVKEAHARVLLAEERFVQSQERRRNAHIDLVKMQNQLRELRGELDRTPRGNEKYLELVTREINVMREERHVRQEFEDHEKREREAFNELSSALRYSHEKERAQNEKTKYWSVFGSLVGACVGIIGTSINSQLKIRQLKKVMTESSAEGIAEMQEKLALLISQIDEAVSLRKLSLDPSPNVTTPVVSEEVESRILSSLSSVSQQLESLNTRLEKVEETESGTFGSGDISRASNFIPPETYEKLLQVQETSIKKSVSVAAVTVLLCVPLVNKIFSSFF